MALWHPMIKALHWLMAVMLCAMLALGFTMTRLAHMAEQSGDYGKTLLGLGIFDLYQLHKSLGVVLFFIAVLRLLVRRSTQSATHSGMSRAEHVAAHIVHIALYGSMLSLPVSGWMLAASSPLGIPTMVFGLFPLPHLIGPSAGAERVWSWVHFIGGLALVALVTLHISAALKHHFWNRDGVLLSMLPHNFQLKRRNIR